MEIEHPDLSPDLTGAALGGLDLSGFDLSQTNLSRADLSGSDLWQTNFWGSDLSEAMLIRATLTQTNFSHADLSRAALYKATLLSANLSYATLRQANLNMADLRGANLHAANLQRVTLIQAILSETLCTETDFTEAEIGGTFFAHVDLKTAKGLETVIHRRPSSIDIETIYRSDARIPEHFLRQVGVPDLFLSYIPSLVMQPIDSYACFIRYAQQDSAFVRRLYADLQSEGVRCWLVNQDTSHGIEARSLVDKSIRIYDLLLLVLSEHALESDWVVREVEAALALEQQQQRTILIPLYSETAATGQNPDWLTRVTATRAIEDFSEWKRYDLYQKAFQRLLQILKASIV